MSTRVRLSCKGQLDTSFAFEARPHRRNPSDYVQLTADPQCFVPTSPCYSHAHCGSSEREQKGMINVAGLNHFTRWEAKKW